MGAPVAAHHLEIVGTQCEDHLVVRGASLGSPRRQSSLLEVLGLGNAGGSLDRAPGYKVIQVGREIDSQVLEVARAYWQRERDPATGAMKWAFHARDLAKRLGLKSANSLGPTIAETATCVADDPCRICGGPRTYSTRSRFTEGYAECRQCSENSARSRDAKAQQEREARQRAMEAKARLEAFLADRAAKARNLDREEAQEKIDELSPEALAILHTLAAARGSVPGSRLATGITESQLADLDLAIQVLVDQDLVILHGDPSSTSTFAEDSDGFRYVPRGVGLSTVPLVAQLVNARLAHSTLGAGARPLIAGLFTLETVRFIHAEVGRFDWPIEFTEPQRQRIWEIIAEHPQLTLGQCFAAAWAAVDSCTATVQAHPYMAWDSVASRIVNLLQEKVNSIVSGRWAPNPFFEHRNAPMRPITRHVITDIYGRDVLQTPWGDVQPPGQPGDVQAETTRVHDRLTSLGGADDADLLAACGGSLPVAALVRAAAEQYPALCRVMPQQDAALVAIAGLTYLSRDVVHLASAARVCGHDAPEALFPSPENAPH